jgi:hypothetical protein
VQEALLSEAVDDESLGQRSQGLDLATLESSATEGLRVGVEELLRLWEAAAEEGFQATDDRTRRAHGQLLADHLKQERPERVHLRQQLLHPLTRVEVGVLVHQPSEHGIRLPKVSARRGVAVAAHGCPST